MTGSGKYGDSFDLDEEVRLSQGRDPEERDGPHRVKDDLRSGPSDTFSKCSHLRRLPVHDVNPKQRDVVERAPAAAIAVATFRNACSTCAARSPAPTGSPSAVRATCPEM